MLQDSHALVYRRTSDIIKINSFKGIIILKYSSPQQYIPTYSVYCYIKEKLPKTYHYFIGITHLRQMLIKKSGIVNKEPWK